MTAVPPPSDALLARGHDLTRRLRNIEADLSAWIDELPASSPETVDAKIHGEVAMSKMKAARVDIGVFTQIAAGMG